MAGGHRPHTLAENDPNRRMVPPATPSTTARPILRGRAGRRAADSWPTAGKPLPFVDQAIFTREKEAIPYWNKFLQGYYDASGISPTVSTRRCGSMSAATSPSPTKCGARASVS